MIKKNKKIFFSRLIDIFIISFIGFVLFFLIFFLRRKQELITFKLKVTDRDVLYSNTNPSNLYAHAFIEGDFEKNELGQKIAEIKKVSKISEDKYHKSVYLDIELKATYSPRSEKYSFRGRPIIYGQPFIFEFSNVKVEGIVVDFPGYLDGLESREYKKVVKAQIINENRDFSDVYGIKGFEADAINIGDEVKDSDGNVLIKILNVEVKPAKRTVFTDKGKTFLISDIVLKDVFLELELLVREINGKLFVLDYVPLYIGGTLPLNLDNISFWPVVTEIYNE